MMTKPLNPSRVRETPVSHGYAGMVTAAKQR